MIKHEKPLYKYFTPYHRKYSGQHNFKCEICTASDGKAEYNTVVYMYTTAFLCSDWLYFLGHGLNKCIQLSFCIKYRIIPGSVLRAS